MELMLVNLRLAGLIDRDLSNLRYYCEKVARATKTSIPPNYPVIGHDAFRTATGVHAAAIIKAIQKHDHRLADAVYSGVPAHLFGMEQVIEIDRKSTRLNSSHLVISYAVFCLKKKTKPRFGTRTSTHA